MYHATPDRPSGAPPVLDDPLSKTSLLASRTHAHILSRGRCGRAGWAESTGQVIRWWELRRLLYNVVLLVVGVAAIAGMEGPMTRRVIPLGEDAVEPMILVLGVVVYGVMVNLCYTLGWIIELWSWKSNPVSARRRGEWMFRAGLLFLCVPTSLPFWFACVYWALHRGHIH